MVNARRLGRRAVGLPARARRAAAAVQLAGLLGGVVAGSIGCGGGVAPSADTERALEDDRADQPARTTVEALSPLGGFETSVHDDVSDLPDGRIRWESRWELCWLAHPDAAGYELQTMTSEGASPTVTGQADRCVSLQIAAGENDAAQGLLNRDMIVASTAGQVGYRVRAVGQVDGAGVVAVSPWSTPFFAGLSAADPGGG